MSLKLWTGTLLVLVLLMHPVRVWLPYDTIRILCLAPSPILGGQACRWFIANSTRDMNGCIGSGTGNIPSISSNHVKGLPTLDLSIGALEF